MAMETINNYVNNEINPYLESHPELYSFNSQGILNEDLPRTGDFIWPEYSSGRLV